MLVIKQIVGKDAEGANVYLLSLKRLEARKAWTELEGKEGEILTVKVTKDVKGGLSVHKQTITVFVDLSQRL